MLDQIIENINQKIRKEIIQPGMDNIPLNYILASNIPDSVRHFFDQEVEIWIREEGEKFSSGDKFDYDNPEIQMLLDQIFDILKQTATFPMNKFNLLLERAVKLEANYLIRPHQTLTQFLFKDNFVITTIEVYNMLKYFEKFTYYKDAFTEYFNLKYLRDISQTQFEDLINQVDSQIFSKNPLEMTLQVTKTIVSFLNEGRDPGSDSIPLEIAFVACSDRNLGDYAALIEKEKNSGTNEITIPELEQMLRTGKTVSALKATPEEAKKIEEIADIEEEKPQLEVESISVPEKTVEPKAEVEEEEAYEDEYEEEEQEEEEKAVPSAAEALADVVGEKLKAEQLADLKTRIHPKQRKKFIKKVFHKKERQYEEIISSLNKTPDWKQASNMIDDFFMRENINPYSREALEFSDLVYSRYFPKDITHKKGAF